MASTGGLSDGERETANSRLAKIAKYMAIGVQFPSTIFAGLVVGYLMDRYFDTSPWLLVAMAFGSFFVAVIQLIQWARRFSKENP